MVFSSNQETISQTAKKVLEEVLGEIKLEKCECGKEIGLENGECLADCSAYNRNEGKKQIIIPFSISQFIILLKRKKGI